MPSVWHPGYCVHQIFLKASDGPAPASPALHRAVRSAFGAITRLAATAWLFLELAASGCLSIQQAVARLNSCQIVCIR